MTKKVKVEDKGFNRKTKRRMIKSHAKNNHVTFSKSTKSIIFISDLHIGSIWGCCSDSPVIGNKDQHYVPWKFN